MTHKILSAKLAGLCISFTAIAVVVGIQLFPDPGTVSPASRDNPYAAAHKFVTDRLPVEQRAALAKTSANMAPPSLPLEPYMLAREQMRTMNRYSLRTQLWNGTLAKANTGIGNNWEALGPGNQGGRTRKLVIDPNNPAIMYAAAATGGVFKTTDAGTSWTAIGDMLPFMATSSLVMDPTNSNTLYLGTGEVFTTGPNGASFRGNGVYRTTDAGATWTRLGVPSDQEFEYISDIVISPSNNQRLYVATRLGIYRSNDGGSSWTKSYSVDTSSGFLSQGCTDLAIRTDQGANDVIVAACDYFPNANSDFGVGQILRNVDADGSDIWTEVHSTADTGRITLAIAPSNQEIIYALAAYNVTNGSESVLRSTDGGATWTAQVSRPGAGVAPNLGQLILSNPATCPPPGDVAGYGRGQGNYDNIIAVDPINPDIVWAGGIDLFRSDNGGVDWSVASYWFLSTSDDDYTHADHHDIVFHPNYDGNTNQTMYVTSDGGVQRTDNARVAGLTSDTAGYCDAELASRTSNGNRDTLPISWTNLNKGFSALQFYHGLADPSTNTRYLGGSQDNGTNLGTDAGGIDGWVEISGGDGGFVAIDHTNPNIIFAEFTNLDLVKFTDGGATPNNFVNAINGISDPSSSFPFINPFIMDPNNPQNLWMAGDRVWRTTDQADNWVAASTAQFDGNSRANSFAVAPADSNLVLIGRTNGTVLRNTAALSADDTTVWTSVTASAGVISSLSFEPGNAQVVYATVSNLGQDHVLKSTDAGLNWTAIDKRGQTGGIPDIPAHSIAIDPDDVTRLFVGTDMGVYVSTDGGASWGIENDGLAPVIVAKLQINKIGNTKTLFAFTHGRGAYRATLGANTDPVANDDAATVVSNSSAATINVLANDTDADQGQTLTVTAVGTTSNGGTASVTAGGVSVTYAPAANFVGTETFSYTISDGNGGSATGNVTVTVSNQNPVANNDTASVAFNSSNNTITVLGNDSDPESQNLTVTAVGTTSNGGSASVTAGGGSVTYSPANNFSGDETFTYTISDNNGGTATATVTVTVAANTDPVANDDTATVVSNSSAATIDVLTNDTDADQGQNLTVTAVGTTSNGGTASVTAGSASVTYAPASNFVGTETFSYTISDGSGGTASATVTVTVSNQNPTAAADAATVASNSSAAAIDVLTNDSDPESQNLTVTAAGTTSNGGTASVTAGGASVTYAPAANFVGTETFDYTISDGNGGTASATVTVTVSNQSPTANVDSATVTSNSSAATIDVLTNDSDPESQNLTVTAVGTTSNGGTASVTNGGGSVTYAPAANFVGTETFTYNISDGNGGTASSTVTVTVNNQNPTANADSATVGFNSSDNTVSVLSNDTDPESQNLTVTAVGATSNGGTATVTAGGGSVTYSPATDFSGTETFTYTISDGNGGTATATVTMTVSAAPNTDPVANDDSASVGFNSSGNVISVLTNDTDTDQGQTLTVTAVGTTSNGGSAAVTAGGGSVTYSPATDFSGTETFSYTISDGNGGSASATVTVTVAANANPVANNDSATVAFNSTDNAIAVLSNDTDADQGQTLTVTAVGTTSNGGSAAVTAGGGSVTYSPAADFSGTETFSYTISDGKGGSASATVTVTVTANANPVANNDSATVAFNSSGNVISVLGNDTDADQGQTLTVTAVGTAGNGTASVTAGGGSVTYSPNTGYEGADSFSYTISDGKGGTANATVNITVSANPNVAPVANNDSATVAFNSSGNVISVLANDTDADQGQTLTVTAVGSTSSGGSASVTAGGGSVTYSPTTGFSGTDSFTYTISDGNGGSASATVTVTVSPAPNNNPVANDDTASVDFGSSGNVIPVLTNDTDPDQGQNLIVSSVGTASNGGSATVTAGGGSVTYAPASNFSGTETFTYTISDGNGGSASATVTVTVGPKPNTAPVANDDSIRVEFNAGATTISVLANDSDVDSNQTLSVTAVGTTSNGGTAAVTAGGGSVTYSSATDFSGTETFSYTISDGAGGTASATVTVTVNREVQTSPDADSVQDSQGNNVPVSTSNGDLTNLSNAANAPTGSTPPANVSFANGFFSFNVERVPIGGSSTVTITLPAGSAPDTYFKVANGVFTEFLFDGTTGATFNGNVITLQLVDGGRGDADGVADGIITDPGAPGVKSKVASSGDSGGAMGWGLVGIGLLGFGLRRRVLKAARDD